MSTRHVIEAHGLSKAYVLGTKEKSDTFFGSIVQAAKAPFTNFRNLRNLSTFGLEPGEERDGVFWALQDVSFEVNEGEALGIVGHNGAGKSTLLKLLSRIADPTCGTAEIRGRVSALLEVGTGFHPELTGRENLYLNGAILGMRRREIDDKFDEIVDFSGVERFLDTPVKRYSSGMKVRLAFAVAAHLEPEVLIVDEVLAVGDADFQKKCLGKMQEVAGNAGRTVLFVSHNMGAVQALTDRCLMLSHGQTVTIGPTDEVVKNYMRAGDSAAMVDIDAQPRGHSTHGTQARVVGIESLPEDGIAFEVDEPARFRVRCRAFGSVANIRFGVTLMDAVGSPVLTTYTLDTFDVSEGDEPSFVVTVPDVRLGPGYYHCAVALFTGDLSSARTTHDSVRPGLPFEVASKRADGSVLYNWTQAVQGPIVHPPVAMERS